MYDATREMYECAESNVNVAETIQSIWGTAKED